MDLQREDAMMCSERKRQETTSSLADEQTVCALPSCTEEK